jgi:hypothetical protein
MRPLTTHNEIAHYFEYSPLGIEVLDDGLAELTFGEFLVEQRALSRYQLLRALQMQDQHPGARLGECVAALGFLPVSRIEGFLHRWNLLSVVEVDDSEPGSVTPE